MGDDPGFVYRVQRNGDRIVAGIFESNEAPPGWSAYFAVDDADATSAKATELGGRTARPAADTPYGRMAVLVDPAGAAFSVIKLAPEATGS